MNDRIVDSVASLVASDIDVEVEYDFGPETHVEGGVYKVYIFTHDGCFDDLIKNVEKDQSYEQLTGIVNDDRRKRFYLESGILARQRAFADDYFKESLESAKKIALKVIGEYDYESEVSDYVEGLDIESIGLTVADIIEELERFEVETNLLKLWTDDYWTSEKLLELLDEEAHPGYSYYDDDDSTDSLYALIIDEVTNDNYDGLEIAFKENDWGILYFNVVNKHVLDERAVKMLKAHSSYSNLLEMGDEALKLAVKNEDKDFAQIAWDVGVSVEATLTEVEDQLDKSLASGALAGSIDNDVEELEYAGVFDKDARDNAAIAESVKSNEFRILWDDTYNAEWLADTIIELKA